MAKNSSKKSKKSTAQIICDELIKVIKEENKMPWQMTFLPQAPKNYITRRYYRGFLNVLFCNFIVEKLNSELKIENPRLDFITFNQLVKYNEQNKSNFRITEKGYSTKVIFSKPYQRELNESERLVYENVGYVPNLHFDDNGHPVILTWMRQYTTVFPVDIIEDDKGNKLPTIDEENEDSELVYPAAQDVVDKYCSFSGVKVNNTRPTSFCFYRESEDTVYMTPTIQFTTTEEYYRTLFHELGHSTGIKSRLNRSCFKHYHEAKSEHSREELVAEMTSLLSAVECGFKNDFSVQNSYAYISSWIEYIENNPNEVLIGMAQAQKACDYIFLKDKDNLSNDNLILSKEVAFD